MIFEYLIYKELPFKNKDDVKSHFEETKKFIYQKKLSDQNTIIPNLIS